MKTIGFIGGGRITRILLQGFRNANVSFEKICVYDINESVKNDLQQIYPEAIVSVDDPGMAASSDWVFIALHPPLVLDYLVKIKTLLKSNALVVSLAPRITIASIEQILDGVTNIARMNPNAGSYVNEGYNPVCFGNKTDKGVVDEYMSLFKKLGRVPVVAENQIEAYAVISAMGHTYFWFQLEQLKELAMSYGMKEKQAQETITAMLGGTVATLFHSGLSYQEVTDLVPVKPLSDSESIIRDIYKAGLDAIFTKIKP